MTEESLKGKIALVTGGSRGIGRVCCQKLAESGAHVAVNYHSNQAAAEETVAMVESLGVRGFAIKADVSCPEQVQAMKEAVTAELGSVELLVNNAGIFHYVTHGETTLDVWKSQMDINLTGTYLTTWAFKDDMIDRRRGNIVNVASIAGLRPRSMAIAYAASKAAVISFTQSTSEAFAEHNVRINAVAPGLTQTDILDGVAQENLDALIDSTPLKRIGQPDEIADVVIFLLSEKSRFMTGQTLVASGGRVLLP